MKWLLKRRDPTAPAKGETKSEPVKINVIDGRTVATKVPVDLSTLNLAQQAEVLEEGRIMELQDS